MSATLIISVLIASAVSAWLTASIIIHLFFSAFSAKKNKQSGEKQNFPVGRKKLIREIAQFAHKNFLSKEQLVKNIVTHDALTVLKPEIELQVDLFLKEKLKDAFPMMHQLMGEKTIGKFREVFLAEVEVLFPVLMKKYSESLLNKADIEELIVEKLETIPEERIEVLKKHMNRPIRRIKLMAVGVGLLVGILEIIIVLLFNQNGL